MDPVLVHEFATAIAGPPQSVDLFRGAMVVACLGGGAPDADSVSRQLDLIAEAVRRHAGPTDDAGELAQAIDFQLFTVLGFHGNSDEYDDPLNSYLDQVLARRTGLPITLSIVYLEVARRVGLRAAGVGYPGHFLVRVGSPQDPIFTDPFNQGARLDAAELVANLAAANLNGATAESFLGGLTNRQILQRMLNNLRASFRARRDVRRWRDATELALCIEPWSAALVGERGMLNYRLGDYAAALDDLERFVGARGRETVPSSALRLLGELRNRLRAGGEQ